MNLGAMWDPPFTTLMRQGHEECSSQSVLPLKPRGIFSAIRSTGMVPDPTLINIFGTAVVQSYVSTSVPNFIKLDFAFLVSLQFPPTHLFYFRVFLTCIP